MPQRSIQTAQIITLRRQGKLPFTTIAEKLNLQLSEVQRRYIQAHTSVPKAV